jgi:hypothetical protein
MKVIRNIVICLAVMLPSVRLIHAQDLSKYRQFSLGAGLAEVSKQIEQRVGEATVVQQSPAMIQQMEWWPVPLNFLTKPEPVQKVIFSFYNQTLYKIEATYNSDATAGLTVKDIIQAISATYGPETKATSETKSPPASAYRTSTVIAHWEDARYEVRLSHDSGLDTFQLVLLSKQLDDQAKASIIEAARQQRADAPQNQIVREGKAAADLETQRQANLKAFRP